MWCSICAFLPVLAQSLGAYDIHLILPGNYGELTNAILGLLVLAGIINNPTTVSKGFLDDK